MKSYEINNKTLALIPSGKNLTDVIEEEKTFVVNLSCKKIIENSCEYFGSTYLGRIKGTQNLIGINVKVPIIIEESENIIYFPTTSPRLNECIWLSLNHIDDYKNVDRKTLINFKNGQDILINVSYWSFNNLYLRAIKLEKILNKRKQECKNV